MKGVNRYLKKHGYHFTTELVKDAVPLKWSPDNIMDTAQKRVYYNVTGATEGDMVYITHWLYGKEGWPEAHDKGSCVKWMLWFIGNYDVRSTYFFSLWLSYLAKEDKDFDFTPYI